MMKHAAMTFTAMALVASPAAAQEQPAPHHDMMSHMVCEMGVLPPMGMGAMQRMGGMQHGAPAAPAAPGHQHAPPAAPAQPPQQHQHGHAHGAQPAQPAPPAAPAMPRMQHGETMGGMGGGMKHPVTAAVLLEHDADMGLSLTDAQQAQLRQLAGTAKESCEAHLQAAHAAHAAALSALNAASPDLVGYEQKLNEAASHAVMAHVPVMRAAVDARALLTAEQRAKLPVTAGASHH